MSQAYWLYMTSNQRNTVVYIGVTNDLERRMSEHRLGPTKSYTRRYNATKLVYHELYSTPDEAIAREKQIKGWKRDKKDQLIATMNPNWTDLSVNWNRDPSLRSG